MATPTHFFLFSCFLVFLLFTTISASASVPFLIYIAFFSLCHETVIVTQQSFKCLPLSKACILFLHITSPLLKNKFESGEKSAYILKSMHFFSRMLFERNVCLHVSQVPHFSFRKTSRNSWLIHGNAR